MNIRKLCKIGMIGLAVSGLVNTRTSAKQGPPVPKEKKIIAFAPDVVDTFYLKKHIAELEKLPIDGVILAVHPKPPPEGKLYLGRTSLAAGVHEREDYRQAVTNLKTTRFKRFTDNFIDFAFAAQNSHDWIDQSWSVYAKRAAVLAHVAKQGGLKGLVMDTEQYGGMNLPVPYPFAYVYRKDRSERSFEEIAAQVRKRGRELMEAIVAEYADITVIMIPGRGSGGSPEGDLLPAFVDGILEGRGPRATLVDGMESAYPLALRENFSKLRQLTEKAGSEMSLVPDLYRKNMRYGLGFWVDFDARFNGAYNGWHTDPGAFEENYRSPERLEHSLYNALTVSDRYVWLFAIHPQVWWRPELLKKENLEKQRAIAGTGWSCRLCPHSGIPKEYLEALRNCRKPHDPEWAPEEVRSMELEAMRGWCPALVKTNARKPEDLEGENILANSSFEAWDDAAPGGWQIAGEHRKFVSREDTVVKDGSHCLKVSAPDRAKWIYVTQSVPAGRYTGKTLIFGVWTKSDLPHAVSVNLIDFIETTGRQDEGGGKFTTFEGRDGWRFKTVVKTIRKNATRVSFYLDSSFPVEGNIYCDGAVAVVAQ